MSGRDEQTRGNRPVAGRRVAEDEFEALLERAMRIEVPVRGAVPKPARSGMRRLRWAAMAASVLLAVGVTIKLMQDYGYISTGDLGRDVVAHIHHEPAAIRVPVVRAQNAVPEASIESVLQAAGARLEGLQPMVRYARLCPFRGEMVAHFVVQGDAGPVTVLLLPDEEVGRPLTVDEDGFVGTVVPLEAGGSIAVVGQQGETLDEIQREVAAAVRWRL